MLVDKMVKIMKACNYSTPQVKLFTFEESGVLMSSVQQSTAIQKKNRKSKMGKVIIKVDSQTVERFKLYVKINGELNQTINKEGHYVIYIDYNSQIEISLRLGHSGKLVSAKSNEVKVVEIKYGAPRGVTIKEHIVARNGVRLGEESVDSSNSAVVGKVATGLALAAVAMVLGADSDFDGGDFDTDAGELDMDGDGVMDSLALDTDGDGNFDTVLTDTDGDGGYDMIGTDTDGDGRIDTVGWDSNGDGNLDTIGVDSDNDGQFDSIGVDSDGDGLIDAAAFDTDGNGTFDTVALDVNGDGIADTVGLDTNGNGKIDKVI